MYLPTDSLYPFLLYTGSAWQYFFNGAALAPPSGTFGWTNQVSASVTAQTNGSWSFAYPGNGGATNEVNVYDAATPSVPFTQVYRFIAQLNNVTAGNTVGVALRESGTGKLLLFGPWAASADCVLSNTTVAQLPCMLATTYTAAAGGTAAIVGTVGDALQGGAGLSPICLKITVASGASGAITMSFSTDNGFTFTTLYNVAKTTPFTTAPDHIGIYGNSTNLPVADNNRLTLLGIN